MQAELESLGLTKNEAKIYLFLLKNGQRTTGPIIKETGIANSRVYETLHSLISKGLVNYTLQKEGKYFQAASPNALEEREEERKKKIASLMPSLKNLESTQTTPTTSAVYEGFDGFKTAFKKIIDDCPANGTIYIIGFSKHQYATKSLRTFLTNMNLKSAKKKQKLKLIFDRSAKASFGKDREKEKYNEVRYLPQEYMSPAAIDIMQDYVYIFLWEEKPFVYMIKNQKIAESFQQYFNVMWNLAKKQ
ncbi:TrmB family transcriptional regulator [Candidatus Woesearchaeota archaeon]|nr:MAG: TrmB family transcriptional regulator [Candidatus Woesearchaeota archaeon]